MLEVFIIFVDWRQPPIPRIIIRSERIDKLLRADVGLPALLSRITNGPQILGKDHVVRMEFRLQTVRSALTIPQNICVATRKVRPSRRGA